MPDSGDVGTLVTEQILGDRPAAILVADEVGDRALHVVQEHFVDVVAAVERLDRPHADARRLMSISRNEMPSCGLPSLRGAHQAEHPVRPTARTRSRSSGR